MACERKPYLVIARKVKFPYIGINKIMPDDTEMVEIITEYAGYEKETKWFHLIILDNFF